MEIILIQILGAVIVLGGALFGFLWFLTKLWFVLMGARALVKYVDGDESPKSRQYGTHVSKWRGTIPQPKPRYGQTLRVIKGGRDEV